MRAVLLASFTKSGLFELKILIEMFCEGCRFYVDVCDNFAQ